MAQHHSSQSYPSRLAGAITAESSSGGTPLDVGLRRSLEDGFDIDLSAVQIHDTLQADRLARSMQADAFAVGAHLFFRAGAYDPGTEAGMRLLAHEITHSIEQAHGWVDQATADVESEIRADAAAGRVLAGQPAQVGSVLECLPRGHVGAPMVIQRHASWEHRLLGDAPSADLNSIAQRAANRPELLSALRDYLEMWQQHPDAVTQELINRRYPEIRTMTLKASGLLVTYGELNTLPDYLANAQAMDDLPRDVLRPILQAVRQEGYANARRLLGIDEPFLKFEGAVAMHLSNGTMNDIWESLWLNDLTRDLPSGLPADSHLQHTDAYSPLLARNACHFAPHSWYRWAQSYDLALSKAQEYHRTGDPQAQRAAWIFHGYADHFLQDSFAAGHLVNKTQVMQWFVEWAAPRWLEKVPDWVELQTMTAARQPAIAGAGLYNPAAPGGVRDPQTAQEQSTREARMDMSGVLADAAHGITRDAAYQNYLTFLNNSVTQSAPLALHDDLNRSGVFVASRDRATPYQLFGDNTMLNGGDGVGIASETAHMSQQSILDVLQKGTTTLTRDKIQSRFPTLARGESGEMLPLQAWNTSLRGHALKVFEGVHDLVLGSLSPRMGHVSQDQSYFVIRLSYRGKVGYLGRDGENWARLVDRDRATKLRLRTDGKELCYGTEDDWWLSVGTAPGRRGYVGFWWWNNSGHPDWQYNGATKRLTSSYYDRAEMSMQDDGYIYCWKGFSAADIDLQDV